MRSIKESCLDRPRTGASAHFAQLISDSCASEPAYGERGQTFRRYCRSAKSGSVRAEDQNAAPIDCRQEGDGMVRIAGHPLRGQVDVFGEQHGVGERTGGVVLIRHRIGPALVFKQNQAAERLQLLPHTERRDQRLWLDAPQRLGGAPFDKRVAEHQRSVAAQQHRAYELAHARVEGDGGAG